MSGGINLPLFFNIETNKTIDARCVGDSRDTSNMTFAAIGLLRYETDKDAWKYYDNNSNWVNLLPLDVSKNGDSADLDGTTTLSQTLTSTNKKLLGSQVKITSNSEYIFALEDTASGNGPYIYIYKKSLGGSYSLHKTKVVSGINSTVINTRINIKPDGSSLVVAQVDTSLNQNTIYLTIYNYNSITDDWDVSNINATPIKTWGVSFDTNLQKVHEFMSPNGKYIAFGHHEAHVSGGSSGDGAVTVFTITGSGSNMTVSEVIEFSYQPNSNLNFGAESMLGISNNGYMLIYSYQNGIDTTGAGKVYLYKINFTANPVTATFKWSLTNPTSLTTNTAGDAFGLMPVIDEYYFAFSSHVQDNPETGSNNVGAIFVYDYNHMGFDTNPVLIKDASTTNDYSFFGGSTTDNEHKLGESNITLRVNNSKIFVYTGGANAKTSNQDYNGLVGIFSYDLSNGPTNSTWSNTELILPPTLNPSGAPYNFGLSCAVSNDTIIISGPGRATSTQPTNQIIQVRSLNTNSVTIPTYATINGTIGLIGGLALGPTADIGTAGQVLVSGGPSGIVKWKKLERTAAKATNTTGNGTQIIPHAAYYAVNWTMHNGNVNSWSGTYYTFNNTGDFKITVLVDVVGGLFAADIIQNGYAYLYKNYNTASQVELVFYRLQTSVQNTGETYITVPYNFNIVESFSANDTLSVVLYITTSTGAQMYTTSNGTHLTITQLHD